METLAWEEPEPVSDDELVQIAAGAVKNTLYDAIQRRKRFVRVPSGKSVRLRERGLLYAEKHHRHGPLPSSILHAFTKAEYKDETGTKKALRDWFHETQTPHGGAYFERPFQQAQTYDANCNQIVTDNSKYADLALKEAGRWRENAPKASAIAWKHDFLLSFVTSNFDYATSLAPNQYRFIYHDEVVDKIGTLSFPVNKDRIKPDRFFGIQYLFMPPVKGSKEPPIIWVLLEGDMGTEPLTSQSAARHKSFEKITILYETFFKEKLYEQWFGEGSSVMLLTVTTNQTRMKSMTDIVKRVTGGKGSYHQLFNCLPEFSMFFKPPEPKPELFFMPHDRSEKKPFNLSRP